MVALSRIVERADTILVPSLRARYSITAEGQSASDSDFETFRCSGAGCSGSQGTDVEIVDLRDHYAGLELTEVSLGSRAGFDTATTRGRLDPSFFPGIALTRTLAGFEHAFWGRWGVGAVEIIDGPFSGRAEGISFRGDLRAASSSAIGDATGTDPTGLGSATWTGVAEAASTRLFERRQGSVTVVIHDLSRPRVGVAIDIAGTRIDPPDRHDMPLVRGRYGTGRAGRDFIRGDFYGPQHQETYGVFDTGAWVGAFGAKRQ